MSIDQRIFNRLFWTGLVGLIAALSVGIGEFTMQYSPLGGYGEAGYRYFVNVSPFKLSLGHFLSVLAAPLYIPGYWHLGQMFVQGGSRTTGWSVTLLGGYAFVVGNAWLGGRIYLALTAHEVAAASQTPGTAAQLSGLLTEFGAHNEPLVDVFRIAMIVVSILWIWKVGAGKTLYPRWMAVFSPAALLGAIFLVNSVLPDIGVWLVPAATNVVHLIVFTLSLYCLSRYRVQLL